MANGLISAHPEHLKAELVWANANPASYFAAQTIPLDLPMHAVLVIEHSVHGFSTGATTGRIGYTVIRVGTEGAIQSAYLGASFRCMEARTTGLIFDNGYYINPNGEKIQHNGLNTPMHIYTLKGIHPPVQVDGSIYSTDETWTGDRWIDGKKIYRKVIDVASLGTLGTSTWLIIDTGIHDAETVFFEVAVAEYQGYTAPIPLIHPNGIVDSNVALRFEASSGTIQMRCDKEQPLSNARAIFVLRYTKK